MKKSPNQDFITIYFNDLKLGKVEFFTASESLKGRQFSLFAEEEWFIVDNFALTGGLRYDNNQDFDGQFSPRLYGVWTATETVTFRNELKDKIKRGTGANRGIDVNIGESVIQGLELAARYQFTPDWSLSGNYTYTDSELKEGPTTASFVGDPLVSVPEHMLNARLEWRTTPRLDTFFEIEYRSSAFRPRDFHEPQNGGRAQGAFDALGDFEGFTLFNLGASYQFADNVRLSGVIYNLFDKDFKDYRPYLREDNGEVAFSNVYNNIYEPRRLFLSLIVDF